MGARYYNPMLGRFLSIDPIEPDENNLHSLNRYAYANNNPYKFVDPDGQAAETVIDVISLGLSIKAWRQDPSFVNALAVAYDGLATAVPVLPGGLGILRQASSKGGEITQAVRQAADGGAARAGHAQRATKESAAKNTEKSGTNDGADNVIRVTKEGVALPPGGKYKIPDDYVQNPHGRSGSYGQIENGKFRERLRIDPATPPGQKGPNYSHYHLDGKGTHYSPRPGDRNPGFGQ